MDQKLIGDALSETIRVERSKIISAILMVVSNLEKEEIESKQLNLTETPNLENISTQVENYMEDKGWKQMSFDRIRKRIDEDFDDDLSKRVIREYPDKYRRGNFKGGKQGIVILKDGNTS